MRTNLKVFGNDVNVISAKPSIYDYTLYTMVRELFNLANNKDLYEPPNHDVKVKLTEVE
jgi:hypothetical protein